MIVGAIILFLLSLFSFIVSVRSFMQKGFIFNNAYIYASKKEREVMDKKPHYHQSGVVFLLIGFIFLLNGFDLLFKTDWILYVVITIVVLTLIYAIISSVVIEKNKK